MFPPFVESRAASGSAQNSLPTLEDSSSSKWQHRRDPETSSEFWTTVGYTARQTDGRNGRERERLVGISVFLCLCTT